MFNIIVSQTSKVSIVVQRLVLHVILEKIEQKPVILFFLTCVYVDSGLPLVKWLFNCQYFYSLWLFNLFAGMHHSRLQIDLITPPIH